jgi:hypothetical protein
MEILAVGLAVLGAVGLTFAWLYSLRYVLQYELGPGWFRVKLSGLLTLRRIRLADIRHARLVRAWSFWDTLSPLNFSEAWPSFIFTRRAVLLVKSSGISRSRRPRLVRPTNGAPTPRGRSR